ncbi:MAG: hypothetical protein JOZ68_18060 [Acidimicrobiia bacterium]|nr:hypothetical protein [Acidimicrobiia bacterium]
MRKRRLLTAAALTIGVTVAAGPASAAGIAISGSMEGNNLGANAVHAGDWVAAGYDFKINGSHPTTTIGFGGARVDIPVSCTDGGTVVGTIRIPLAGGPYSDSQNFTDWLPTGDQQVPASFEGAVQAPDLCNGSAMFDTSSGATFSADLQASGSNAVTVRFHYRDPAAKGKGNHDCADAADPLAGDAATCGASWSSSPSFGPSVTDTPVPVGALGGIGFAAVGAGAFALVQRRSRRRLVTP